MHHRKTKSSVESGASESDENSLPSLHKYVLLQAENLKLQKANRKLEDLFNHWKELALQYQAERDMLKEDLKELREDLQARRELY